MPLNVPGGAKLVEKTTNTSDLPSHTRITQSLHGRQTGQAARGWRRHLYSSSMPRGKRGELRGKQCGGVEVVPCYRLDDVLPWASQRVGLLHLLERRTPRERDGGRCARSHLKVDTHNRLGGHAPAQAGQGIASIRGRWLYELGYRHRCFCDGMHWYTTRARSATECLGLPACCKRATIYT